MSKNIFPLNQLKGRIYELVVEELVSKAGFETDINKIDSTQFVNSKGKRIKRLAGRGGTYDPDIVGRFKFPIPFSNPLLLIGECKYLRSSINVNRAREFLGISTDLSQFPRTDIKNIRLRKHEQIFLNNRYLYVPVVFSIKGFQKNAQAFLHTHGISFISYENSPIFDEIERLIENLLSSIYKSKKIKIDFASLKNLKDLNKLSEEAKKKGFIKKYQSLIKYFSKLESFVGLLDNVFIINLITKRVKNIRSFKKVKFNISEGKNKTSTLVLRKSGSSRNFGYVTLPRSFIEEYEKHARKFGKRILQKIALFYEHSGEQHIHYISLEKTNQKMEGDTSNEK